MMLILYENFKSNNVHNFTMNKTLAITVIVLVAVVMVMGAAAPAMAGNHPPDAPADKQDCEALDNPSEIREKAAEGKGKAKTAAGCE